MCVGLHTLCAPESHQVSCKYLSPGGGGGVACTSGFQGSLNGLMDDI
jgi:hypothetical protein